MAETPVTQVRIPTDLRDEIARIAERESRTMSNAIVLLLTEALERRRAAAKRRA